MAQVHGTTSAMSNGESKNWTEADDVGDGAREIGGYIGLSVSRARQGIIGLLLAHLRPRNNGAPVSAPATKE